MRVAMIGTGYVGLVSGACFADFGHVVTCIDKDPSKIERLEKGEIPIFEPGLDDLVARNVREGRLFFTLDGAQAIKDADAVFIAVGTPTRRGDGHADLSYVYAAAEEIAGLIDGFTVVVTKSTVPVGTGDEVEAIIKKVRPDAQFAVVSNPEFLREGAAIEDFKRPDRVVVGTEDERAQAVMRDLYRPLSLNETPIVFTGRRTSELIKYAANAFLAMKITFINEMADLCEKVGADVQSVAKGIGLDKRIGSKFLNAGPGYGGSCFPKDTLATIWDADILIWCISRIVQQRDNRENDIRPVIHTTPYELLKGIARGTSGQDYIELLRAIRRLRTTEVETNIRAGKRRYTAFHYLGDIEGEGESDDNPEQLKTLTLRIPDWLLDGIMSGNILTLDREYFLLTGGIERAIYRVARKHAGNQKAGWVCKMTTLFEKTGSESPLKKFTFRIREMCRSDELPRYAMRETTTADGSPAVHFVDRAFVVEAARERRGADAAQRGREDARAAWLDAERDPKAFDGAWARWAEDGHQPGEFAKACSDRRCVMPT